MIPSYTSFSSSYAIQVVDKLLFVADRFPTVKLQTLLSVMSRCAAKEQEHDDDDEGRQQAGWLTLLTARLICFGCLLWLLLYMLVEGTAMGRLLFSSFASDESRGAQMALNGLILPVLVAATASAAVVLRSGRLNRLPRGGGRPQRGNRQRLLLLAQEPNYRRMGVFLVAIPSVIYFLGCLHRHYHHMTKDGGQWTPAQAMFYLGNSLGMMAMPSMSVLLVPVTRQGPILQLFGWNHAAAVKLHIWMGRVVLVAVVGHSLVHMMRWVLYEENLLSMIIPPAACFSSSTLPANLPQCHIPNMGCRCYDLKRNLAGAVGFVALLCLLAASFVRRRWYSLFYHIHVIAGPLVFIATILHWKASMIYLAGGALYYSTCTVAIFCQQKKPVQMVQAEKIQGINKQRPCLALTFSATKDTLRKYRPGCYVKLVVPELSAVAHPFTVNTTPQSPGHVQLLIRSSGPFTQQLVHRLEQRDLACTFFIGAHFYGCPYRLEQVMSHDVTVLVAGGIGITPYLSLLHHQPQQNKIILHWVCRDPALVRYVRNTYLDCCHDGISVVIHQTGEVESYPPKMPSVYHTASVSDLALSGSENDDTESLDSSTMESLLPNTNPAMALPLETSSMSFSSFLLAIWIGLAGVWFIYSSFQPTDQILPRLLSPLWVLAVAFAISRIFPRAISSGVIDDSVDTIRNPDEAMELLEEGHTSYGSNYASCSVDVRSTGRPSPAEFFEPFVSSQRPGLFMCGPSALLNDIRSAACECSLDVTIYEESFEM